MSWESWESILKKIFKHDALIMLIVGFWKTGKTNVGLKIAEDAKKFGLIKKIGTNIKVQDAPDIKIIEDIETLKEFHFDDPINPTHKCFIFDEAGKHTLKRRAMGKANVQWMGFIPELSKGRMKLIVISQNEFITDSIWTQQEFTRVLIETRKHPDYGYSIIINADPSLNLERPYDIINDFEKTKIKYSPYENAEWFTDKQEMKKEQKLLCCEIAYEYSVENKSTTQIANERGFKSRTQVVLYIKRHLRHTFSKSLPEDIEQVINEVKVTA